MYVDETSDCKESGDRFDVIIGHIEDIMISSDFQNEVSNFMEKHYSVFEDSEENQLEYTDIFKEYTELIEKFIATYLMEKINNFSMKEFLQDLQENRPQLDGEVFEVLSTVSDFLVFKDMILDFKKVKNGQTADFSSDISITSYHLQSSRNGI